MYPGEKDREIPVVYVKITVYHAVIMQGTAPNRLALQISTSQQ